MRSQKKDIKLQDVYIPECCLYLFGEQEQQQIGHEIEIKVDKNVEPERGLHKVPHVLRIRRWC